MGEGTLPTEEVVERRDGERPVFGPLFWLPVGHWVSQPA